MLFSYHKRYTVEQIERIAGRKITVDQECVSGIPGLVSVVDDAGDQYDFTGVNNDNLVLLWINDERIVNEL